MNQAVLQRETMTDRVYAVLKQRITAKHIRPGDRLVADRIARELQVSVTPVRETLRLLERDGLIRNVPHRGAVVVELNRKDVADLFAVRQQLEILAVRAAAEHASPLHVQLMKQHIHNGWDSINADRFKDYVQADSELHRTIAEASGNDMLRVTMLGMLDRVDAFINRTVQEGYIDRAHQALEQHEAIVAAIAARDADAAEKAMRDHLQMSQSNALEYAE